MDQSAVIWNARTWAGGLGVFAFAYFAGTLVCMRWRFSDLMEAALKRVAAGLAVTPIIVLLAGQSSGMLLSFPWWLGAAAGVVLFAVHAQREWKRRKETSAAHAASDWAMRERIFLLASWLAVGATALILLGPALTPPISYDALEYHVGVIPHFFEAGRVTPIPHVFYSAQPIATEMLYTLGAVIEGTPWGSAPGLVGWVLMLATVGMLARALALAGTPRVVTPWLVLLFMSTPVVFKLFLDRFTDLTGAFFVLAGLNFILPNKNADSDSIGIRSALMAGLMAGAAVSSKWTNAGTSALMLAFAISLRSLVAERRSQTLVRNLLAFGAGALAIVLPWAAWVGARTGNPFAPFLAGAFPSGSWSEEQLDFLLNTHHPLAMTSAAYWSNLYGRIASLQIGPPVMTLTAVIALFILARAREPEAKVRLEDESPLLFTLGGLLLGVVGGLLLWGRLRFAADRFLAPIFAAEIVLLGAAVGIAVRVYLGSRTEEPRGNSQANAPMLAAIAFAAVCFFYWPGRLAIVKDARYWDRALGRETADEFLRRGLGETARFFEAANALPENARIMAIGEARRYYFRRPVTLATVFDIHPIRTIIDENSTPEMIAERLRALGYTHLAVNEYETARLLDFHPPPLLERDEVFMTVRSEGRAAYDRIAKVYAGYSEFGVRPLSPEARARYAEFLRTYRERATYFSSGASLYPAFWIAPL